MNLRISLFVCALILIVPVAAAQTPDTTPWKKYSVKGERLSVSLPGLPVLQTYIETRTPPEKDRKRYVLVGWAKPIHYTIHVVENTEATMTLDAFIREETTAYASS